VNRTLSFVRYRLRAESRRRLPGYVGMALVIGLLGGVAMASVAGARRTESSFPTYLASTNPSTVGAFTMYADPQFGLDSGYVAKLSAKIARLPFVTRASTAVIFDGNIDLSSVTGLHRRSASAYAPPAILGSADGELTSMDRVTLLAGHLPGPHDVHGAVINAATALEWGIHIGSVIGFPFYTDAQAANRGSAPSTPRIVTVKVVGEVLAYTDVIRSDYAALNSATLLLSPALTSELEGNYANGTETFLQLAGGAKMAKRVFAEIAAIDPVASHFPTQITDKFEPVVQQAITPEAVALGAFGGIAGLAVLLIAGLMISREVRTRRDELTTLRAVGASPLMLGADEVVGPLGAMLVGSALAVGIAIAFSPLAPLGPVRPVYPDPGVAIDGLVLGVGFAVLVVVLGVVAVLAGFREVRRTTPGHREARIGGDPRWIRTVASAGLPVSMETGLRFATQAGRGRNAAPVRSAMLGGVLAVTVLVSAVTFGSSLNSLVSHPAYYGWNWNYALLSGFAGAEDLPGPQVAALLNKDRDVAQWSGINIADVKLDGQRVEVMTEHPGAPVAPPILSGHGLASRTEIVVGPATLAQLHKHVGDTVTLTDRVDKPTTLTVVGTTTLPAITQNAGAGTGALVATSDIAPKLLNLQDAPILGPSAVLVRLRPGVASSAGLRSLEAINADINRVPLTSGLGGGVVGALRPTEIVNFRSMGTTPAVFAAALSLGAIAALGLTLAASVRRRRRELALLKSLGFTRRQLAASIAWQATTAATVGIVLGIPAGLVLGARLWLAFAHSINVVPEVTVSITTMALIAVGALVFAILVAVLPGGTAARTPTAVVLRSE
jgi:hypothetical protein